MNAALLLLLPLVAAIHADPPLTQAAASAAQAAPAPQTDLDALMEKALQHRAGAWKTMEQYILNEREQFEVRGPLGIPLFGERRDFTWFVRDGYFVRSPLEFNGVKIGDEKRREYEANWLKSEHEREQRTAEKRAKAGAGNAAPADVDAMLKQTSEPRFISAAYFLNFTFEPGNYYFAGRETFEGQPVVKVEYFPRRLFHDSDDDREGRKKNDKDHEISFDLNMNKVARITLWVDPDRAMILKYVFENVALDFLPAQWLVRVDDVRAEMAMSQPFPGIWLPKDMGMQLGMTLANGTYDMRYALSFYDYRMGDVKSRIKFDGRLPDSPAPDGRLP